MRSPVKRAYHTQLNSSRVFVDADFHSKNTNVSSISVQKECLTANILSGRTVLTNSVKSEPFQEVSVNRPT